MSATANLTREQALQIRERYSNGDRGLYSAGMTTLAAQYGVSRPVIHRVLTGEHPAAQGLPNIAGRRGNAYGKSAAGGLVPSSSVSPPSERLKRHIPRTMSTKAERKLQPCPQCHARPGEPCWSRGTILRALSNFHPARKVPAPVTPPAI